MLINKDFLPTSHIFYTVRVLDVIDKLPKWETYPGVGEPLNIDANGIPVAAVQPTNSNQKDEEHNSKKAKTSTH